MINRAALGLAVLLASAPFASAASAADWDGDAGAAHQHARVHHRHHHHHHSMMMKVHRRVLYRNPAYGTRWARPRSAAAQGWYGHQRWRAAYGHSYGCGASYHARVAPRPAGYAYAHRVAGSYVGGGLLGALYNQPSCYCR